MGTRQITSMAAALQASNFVTEQSIELVAHSPLERARQTSQGLLKCMAPDLKAPSVQRVTELDILKEKYLQFIN
jgi:phosphohistidine phosphatase SixA